MRLNAYLARAGIASRRGADEIIKARRVEVNGKIGQLNTQVEDADSVKLDGKRIDSQRLRYILLYKPERTVTTLKDPQDRPKILDNVKIPQRVVPVGRLDFNTTGALLLTNDGELAHRLMHPSFEVDKVYVAKVDGIINHQKLNMLSNGVKLEDPSTGSGQVIRTAPAKVRNLGDNKVELIIHEGRKHQVKRMLEAVDLPVKKLHRSRYGPLSLEGLRPSQWRDLTKQEVNRLKHP